MRRSSSPTACRRASARSAPVASGSSPGRTVSGRDDAAPHLAELQVVLEGVFEKRRFLDLVRYFIVFEDSASDGGGGTLIKKMAGYHQFHAVNVAVEETLRAAKVAAQPLGRYAAGHQPGGEEGDQRVGVVWHTQGSGKSLTMAFYAGRVILHPAMENPTIVVLTDRNDLDDQLFGTFARCHELLRQPPVQAENRADLRNKLRVASGGVVFTTIQKFFPEAPPSESPSPQSLSRGESNCVESQAIVGLWKLGFQGVLVLKIAFMMESSLCMQATKTTFLGLPLELSR
jgi:type I restriction enzyme R subunit